MVTIKRHGRTSASSVGPFDTAVGPNGPAPSELPLETFVQEPDQSRRLSPASGRWYQKAASSAPKGGFEQRPFHGGIWRDLTSQFVSNMTDVWENRHSPVSAHENSDQFVRSCPGSSRKSNLFWLARIVQPHECQNTAMLRNTNGAALPWLLMLSPNDDPSRTGAGEHCALSFPWPAFGNSAAFGRAKDHGVDRSLARYRTRNGEAVFRGGLADHHLFAPAFRWRPMPLGCWIE